jgi:hypothetical protein
VRQVSFSRARLLEETGRSKEEHRGDALAFYESVIRAQDSTTLERLRAQERIDKLFGLEAPAQTRTKVEADVREEFAGGARVNFYTPEPAPDVHAEEEQADGGEGAGVAGGGEAPA